MTNPPIQPQPCRSDVSARARGRGGVHATRRRAAQSGGARAMARRHGGAHRTPGPFFSVAARVSGCDVSLAGRDTGTRAHRTVRRGCKLSPVYRERAGWGAALGRRGVGVVEHTWCRRPGDKWAGEVFSLCRVWVAMPTRQHAALFPRRLMTRRAQSLRRLWCVCRLPDHTRDPLSDGTAHAATALRCPSGVSVLVLVSRNAAHFSDGSGRGRGREPGKGRQASPGSRSCGSRVSFSVRQFLLSRRKLLYPEMQALGRPFLAFGRKNDDDIVVRYASVDEIVEVE